MFDTFTSLSDRALLVGVCDNRTSRSQAEESFAELIALADTAGAIPIQKMMAPLRHLNPATYFGRGKVEELARVVKENEIGLVLVDAELNPTQGRNLEETFGVRVLDRTGLILDIFALHARTREGRLQVELAQYQYLLPRLVGAWTHLSKQRGGGVGLRGPGETQLEVDRRRVRERMLKLKAELRQVESTRDTHRARRVSVPMPVITLVGYTNAGKSTLFNALTESDEVAENRLFATLDPKTKRLKLPSGRLVLLSDTVGFIRNLPHQLIEAFKSTFEEARHSDCLLHVIDSASEQSDAEMKVVEEVLEDLELSKIPRINVFNKADLSLKGLHLGTDEVMVSALKGHGMDKLLQKIEESLSAADRTITLFIPHPYGKALSELHANARVLETKNLSKGLKIKAILPEKFRKKYNAYITNS